MALWQNDHTVEISMLKLTYTENFRSLGPSSRELTGIYYLELSSSSHAEKMVNAHETVIIIPFI